MWIFKNNSKDLKLPFIQNVKNPLLLSRAQFTNSVGLRALNPIVMIIRMGSLDLITFSDRRASRGALQTSKTATTTPSFLNWPNKVPIL